MIELSRTVLQELLKLKSTEYSRWIFYLTKLKNSNNVNKKCSTINFTKMDLEIFKTITENSLAYQLAYGDGKMVFVGRKNSHFNTLDMDYWDDVIVRSSLNLQFMSLDIFGIKEHGQVHANYISGYVQEFANRGDTLCMLIITSVGADQIPGYVENMSSFEFDIENVKKDYVDIINKVTKGKNKNSIPVCVVVPVHRVHSFYLHYGE